MHGGSKIDISTIAWTFGLKLHGDIKKKVEVFLLGGFDLVVDLAFCVGVLLSELVEGGVIQLCKAFPGRFLFIIIRRGDVEGNILILVIRSVLDLKVHVGCIVLESVLVERQHDLIPP